MGRAAWALAAALAAGSAGAAEPGSERRAVDVVFVLDTTGSMGGLLEGAKQKVWAIANEFAKTKPSPRLRMGLVAFRDKGDAYVTKTFDLTSNLDQTYKDLLSLSAGGGGDGPEHVLKALEDAVDAMSWSPEPRAFKVVYLVGDAPPHEDYGDTPNLEALLQKAVRKGIVVNTVQCGGDPRVAEAWRKAARLGEGAFLAIPQDGGVVAVATPYDEKLAELSRRLERTTLGYGRRRAEVREALALSASVAGFAAAPAAADRAVFKAARGFAAESDLAEAVTRGSVDLSSLREEELPDDLRGLDAAARKARIEKVAAERRELKEGFDELAAKRAKYLASRPARRDSFDAQLARTIKEQLR